jgi:vacuolar-type H+-ATPase subunit B/Vma2
MTITAEATGPASEQKAGVGRIARVTGPVVDVEFPHDAIPEIYNALKTTITIGDQSTVITLEVAQHLGDDVVRAIALKSTDGLVRGQEVIDTGEAISVPVGDITKGKVFNVIGEVLNAEPGETIEDAQAAGKLALASVTQDQLLNGYQTDTSTIAGTAPGSRRASGLRISTSGASGEEWTPRLIPAAKPSFVERTTVQSARASRSATVPSTEPLSTTTTECRSGPIAAGMLSSSATTWRSLL